MRYGVSECEYRLQLSKVSYECICIIIFLNVYCWIFKEENIIANFIEPEIQR